MDNKGLISVIVPIYNVDKYLNKCVESIVNQTYKNLEIILVDDGSPDNCPAICDEWAKKDSRIKVIHKQNGGQSSARNRGIDCCSGEYISFIDSDDYLHEDAYATMIKYFNDDVDMVCCELTTYTDNQEPKTNNTYSSRIINSEEAMKLLFSGKYSVYFVSPCNKLYRKHLFNNLRYKENMIHEDEMIIHRLIGECRQICCLDKILYYYFIRQGSTMHSGFSKKRLVALDAFDDRLDYCKEKFPTLISEAYYCLLNNIIGYYCLARASKEKKSLLKELKEKYNDTYKQIKTNKLKYFVFKYFTNLYYLLYYLKNKTKK